MLLGRAHVVIGVADRSRRRPVDARVADAIVGISVGKVDFETIFETKRNNDRIQAPSRCDPMFV